MIISETGDRWSCQVVVLVVGTGDGVVISPVSSVQTLQFILCSGGNTVRLQVQASGALLSIYSPKKLGEFFYE